MCSIPHQFRRPAIRAVDCGWRRRPRVLTPEVSGVPGSARPATGQQPVSLAVDTLSFSLVHDRCAQSIVPCEAGPAVRAVGYDTASGTERFPQPVASSPPTLVATAMRWTSASGCADGISHFHIRFGPLPSAQGRVAQTPGTCHPKSCIHSPSQAGLLNCLNHHHPSSCAPVSPSSLPSTTPPPAPPLSPRPPLPLPPHLHHPHPHHSTLKNRWKHRLPTVRRHLRTGIPVFRHHFRTRRRCSKTTKPGIGRSIFAANRGGHWREWQEPRA